MKPDQFPATPKQLLELSQAFRPVLAEAKRTPPAPGLAWYPYDTMASMHHLSSLLLKHYPAFLRAFASGSMLDIGCADGDMTYFFASLGCHITAVDNAPTNFNGMTGVRALRERLNPNVEILERDIDSQFQLPDADYGFALLLGTLYHLKNPFYVLELLAHRSRYCAFSTQIAAITPAKTLIRDEPLAYLVDTLETNNDDTNFWMFSPAGLLRLAKRSGWRVIDHIGVGCTTLPNPVDKDADGRMFVFARSQYRSAPANIRLLEGWTERSGQHWAWTLKRFTFDVELLEHTLPPRFMLGFTIPDVVANVSQVKLSATINGKAVGKKNYSGAGNHVFEEAVPGSLNPNQPLHFEFSVEHRFDPKPDSRPLGIIIHFSNQIKGISEPIWFWLE